MSFAVFLDRDGTLIEEKNGLPITDSKDLKLLEGVVEELKWMQERDYLLFVFSNQGGIARGEFTKEQSESVFKGLYEALKSQGIIIAKHYYCPHSDVDDCNCRKPKPGMLEAAVKDFPMIDLNGSYVIEDQLMGIKAGKSVGCTTILLGEKYKKKAQEDIKPDFHVDSWKKVRLCINQTRYYNELCRDC